MAGLSIEINGIRSNDVIGESNGDKFGFSVADAGDVDNDGTYDDIIIGAPRADPAGGNSAGETYVIYGSSSFPASHTIDLDATSADITIYGDDADDECGYSVASGDINGDGITDIIIGAEWASPAGGSGAGETYVIYGSSSTATATKDDDDEWYECAIATACYGTPMASEVKTLSTFRDEHLLTNRTGQSLVKFYYAHSPKVADFIRDKEPLKAMVRAGLKPLVWVAEKVTQ